MGHAKRPETPELDRDTEACDRSDNILPGVALQECIVCSSREPAARLNISHGDVAIYVTICVRCLRCALDCATGVLEESQ